MKPAPGPVKVTASGAPVTFEGIELASWICSVTGEALHWPAVAVCGALVKASFAAGPAPMTSVCIAEVRPAAAAVTVAAPAELPTK